MIPGGFPLLGFFFFFDFLPEDLRDRLLRFFFRALRSAFVALFLVFLALGFSALDFLSDDLSALASATSLNRTDYAFSIRSTRLPAQMRRVRLKPIGRA
jgi:hypothetical protein